MAVKLKSWEELALISNDRGYTAAAFWAEAEAMKETLQLYLGTDLPEPATAEIVDDYQQATSWLGYARVQKGRAASYYNRAKGLATQRTADENPDWGPSLIKDLVKMHVWRFFQEDVDWHNIVKGLQERVWSGRKTAQGDIFERGSQPGTER